MDNRPIAGPRIDHDAVTDVVLLSGGWESTGCAVRAVKALGAHGARALALMFIGYGQPYEQEELVASSRIAARLNLLPNYWPMTAVAMKREGKVFIGRNETFLRLSRLAFPYARRVWLGYRAPHSMFDAYGDSNMLWAQEMSKKFQLKVHSPYIAVPKFAIKREVREAGLEDLVYSSEGYEYENA